MSIHRVPSLNLASEIQALWTVFLLGTLFHTQLGLMPLFHGMSVAESHTESFANLDTVFWGMLIFFALPLLAIVIPTFTPQRQYRSAHFWMTVVYSIFNLAHFIADVAVKAPSYQLALMLFLLGIGFVLNVVAYQWKTA